MSIIEYNKNKWWLKKILYCHLKSAPKKTCMAFLLQNNIFILYKNVVFFVGYFRYFSALLSSFVKLVSTLKSRKKKRIHLRCTFRNATDFQSITSESRTKLNKSKRCALKRFITVSVKLLNQKDVVGELFDRIEIIYYYFNGGLL